MSLTLLCLGASSASALPERFYGMNANGSMYGNEVEWDALSRAGVQRFRMQINWQKVVQAGNWKEPPAWEATYDKYFIAAARHGIEVLPFLYGRDNGSSQYYLAGQAGYTEWLSFVEYVVRRYGQNGTFWNAHPELGQFPVKVWEVWNEPNLKPNCPSESCNGKQYGEFLVKTSAAIRNAQKGYSTTVLFGGLYQEAWNYPIQKYIEAAALATGIKSAYDGLSLHPYGLGKAGEPLRSFPDKAAAIPSDISGAHEFQEKSLGAKPIWVTEVGWPVDEGTNNEGDVQTVDEGEQAGLLNATYNWVKANWTTFDIKYVAWYDYNDVDEPKWESHAGLRDANDDFRQAWYAYEGQTGAAAWPPSYSYKLGTNNGSGFTWGSTNLNNYYQPQRMAVGDINGDGKADIVTVEKEASGGAYVYVRGISNGSGGFAWSGTNLTGMAEALKMDVGDVNGDGKADIVAVERESGGLFRYMLGTSNGAGNFAWNFTNLKGFYRPVAMALGDINGDGRADIVSVEKDGSSGYYTYVRGISDGSGNFAWEGTGLKGMYHPFKMAVGDITGDGKADIVAVEKEPVTGFYNYARGISNGSGGFAWAGTGLPLMYQPKKLSLGDVNGDGKADIVAMERESNGQYDYARGISNGSGGFAWSGTNLVEMNHAQRMDVGDVNGDGKADIVSVEH